MLRTPSRILLLRQALRVRLSPQALAAPASRHLCSGVNNTNTCHSLHHVSSVHHARPPPLASSAKLEPPSHPAYELLRHTYISEHNAAATLYRHRETGAELMSVCCSEVEKVFGIAFRTPVSDSRGLPHILEHSVLCGSKKYPVKEPFVELLKSSLQTYLNAMTYPDRTV